MGKQKSSRRNVIEWVLILGTIAVLYFTGLYTEVIGKVQQLVLITGVVQPDINIPENQQQAANYNLTLISFNDEISSLEQYKNKVVFLNFWASWCPPCRAEMPAIQDLYNKLKSNKDIVFIMVSLDDDTAKAKKFISDQGFTFPTYFVGDNLPAIYNSGTIPSTYVISKKGKIAVKEVGMADYNTEKFEKFLKGL